MKNKSFDFFITKLVIFSALLAVGYSQLLSIIDEKNTVESTAKGDKPFKTQGEKCIEYLITEMAGFVQKTQRPTSKVRNSELYISYRKNSII